jgi:hypothetical protein
VAGLQLTSLHQQGVQLNLLYREPIRVSLGDVSARIVERLDDGTFLPQGCSINARRSKGLPGLGEAPTKENRDVHPQERSIGRFR